MSCDDAVQMAMGSWDSCFVLGGPGTGKSTTMHKLADLYAGMDFVSLICAAPTGAAATLLPQSKLKKKRFQPTTVHRLFTSEEIWAAFLVARPKHLILMIDEMILLPWDAFCTLRTKVRKMVEKLEDACMGHRVVVQYIMFGDEQQMESVDESIIDISEFYAWARANVKGYCRLTMRHRFKDVEYLALVTALEERDAGKVGDLLRLCPAPAGDGVSIDRTNEEVRRHNLESQTRAAAFPGTVAYSFYSPTGTRVMLVTRGCRMIGLRNIYDKESKASVINNGTLCTMESAAGTEAQKHTHIHKHYVVDKHLNIVVLHKKEDGTTHDITIASRHDADPVDNVRRWWIPVACADAITVNKAQGKTYPPPTKLIFRLTGWNAWSMYLTALTRGQEFSQFRIAGFDQSALDRAAAKPITDSVDTFLTFIRSELQRHPPPLKRLRVP
jgi:hypothetical protein